ncbi:hypothetical protein KUTeg_010563 [Tegillarca granosa]|uniref:C-type lectin domain-containing protein n=1 Tax=Tegillarca granosa TaxID=220873 RepID=A0ABQ9F3B0_TEGGR|nr:hypothetical protein KUTeg_010563 [Tegillarca granosa]
MALVLVAIKRYPVKAKNILRRPSYATTMVNDLCEANGYSNVKEINLCVKVHGEPLNWTDARNVCLVERADLFIANTIGTYEYLKDIIHQSGSVWIGARYFEEDCIWRWVDGNILNITTLFNLGISLIKTTNDADCLQFTQRMFHGINCDKKQRFICQRKI